MAKNDDALVFSFGVDVESIKTALDDATRDLKQRIKDANAKLKKDSLVVESQISLLDPKDDSAKIVELITQKKKAAYEVQTAILNQLTTAYSKLTEAEKKSSYGNSLEIKIARQTIATQKALKALNDYTKSQTLGGSLLAIKDDIISSLSAINPAAANAVAGLDKLGQSAVKNFNLLAGKAKTAKVALGASLVGGAVYGFDSWVSSNISAATTKAMGIEQVQRQAEALGTSFADFNKLNTLGKLAGVDIDPLINRLNKLNLTLTKAGEEGNKQTTILDKWGVQLRNLDGTYKPFSEQVAEIAEGYVNASKSGNEYAYAVEVLGGNMSSITPLLRNYNKYLAEANDLQKTGYFDAKSASRIADAKRLLDLQSAQTAGLGGQLSGDAAASYLERMVELKQDWAEFAAENKNLANTVSALGITWEETINNIVKGLAKISETDAGLKAETTGAGAVIGGLVGGGIGAVLGAGAGAVPGAIWGASLGGGIGLGFGDAVAENRKKNEEIQRNDKKTADNAEKQAERQVKAVEKVNEKLEEEKEKKREAANSELADNIYTATHGDEENELYNLEKKVEKYKQTEADETLIAEYAEVERAKIVSKYQQKAIEEARKAEEEKRKVAEEEAKKQAEEEKKAQEETQRAQEERQKAESEISSVFLSEHEKRLKQIDEQKSAWIKAGADELQATKAVEEEKRKARENEAERYLRSQSDLIKRASKLERMGVSGEEIGERLYQYQQKQQLKSLGLTENDISVGAKYMSEINDIVNSVKSAVLQPVTRELTNNNSRVNNNTVNVSIDNPVVTDNSSINRLADKVADKINDALRVGAVSNGY